MSLFERVGKSALAAGHRARGRAPAWARPLLDRALGSVDVPTWYHPDYRLPISGIAASSNIEPRRADFVAWFLLEKMRVRAELVESPELAEYDDVRRVHDDEFLRSLMMPNTLARIYASDPADVPTDEVMRSVRLAVGGTVAAARRAVETRGPTMNLAGGFHHAAPAAGGALCPLNDIAIAVAALRAGGFDRQIAIIDLDAHPPDGTAACLANDERVWIGSLSGSDWGPLVGDVDETVLPEGCDDAHYLMALRGLLDRMPPSALAFVIAGGDVLAGDKFGLLGTTLEGVRRRDLLVARRLRGRGSVWLPGGGYTDDAWRALAGTALALFWRSERPVPADYDPLGAHFSSIAARIGLDELGQIDADDSLDLESELSALNSRARRTPRLLGLWTRGGVEFALHRYGVLPHIRRLGYRRPRVEVDRATAGERLRVFAQADGDEHLLAEAVFDRREVADRDMLFLNWLTLRNPRARFSTTRAPLPGQDAPGLGIAHEALELILEMSRRLELAGVAYRPSYFHTAAVGKADFRFVDPERQGRFEALLRDLAGHPVEEITRALAEKRVTLDGEPYEWEPDYMAMGLPASEDDRARAATARDACRFEIVAPSGQV